MLHCDYLTIHLLPGHTCAGEATYHDAVVVSLKPAVEPMSLAGVDEATVVLGIPFAFFSTGFHIKL